MDAKGERVRLAGLRNPKSTGPPVFARVGPPRLQIVELTTDVDLAEQAQRGKEIAELAEQVARDTFQRRLEHELSLSVLAIGTNKIAGGD
jgi:hypothetical protein